VCATNGADALTVLRGGLRPCMIVLDLMMPVMDGWQFRAEQLNDPELLKIPTVIYSAVGRIDEAVETLNVAGGFQKDDFAEMLRFGAHFCPRVSLSILARLLRGEDPPRTDEPSRKGQSMRYSPDSPKPTEPVLVVEDTDDSR